MEEINKDVGHHLTTDGCERTSRGNLLHDKKDKSCRIMHDLESKFKSRHPVAKIEENMKQENIEDTLFPNISEVNIKLDPSTFSEIQWIGKPQTGLMMQGSARITVTDKDGDARITDLQVGDIWDFKSCYRYSIKILDKGCVFKLYLENTNLRNNTTNGYQIDGNLYIKL